MCCVCIILCILYVLHSISLYIYFLDLVPMSPEVVAVLLSQQFLPSNSSKIQKGEVISAAFIFIFIIIFLIDLYWSITSSQYCTSLCHPTK